MNDILARRARRATAGIALSAALVAGIAPVTAIAAETSSPTGAVALQTEDAAAAKEKAYAAMQEALKKLEAAKNAASPEKIAEIDTKIAIFHSSSKLLYPSGAICNIRYIKTRCIANFFCICPANFFFKIRDICRSHKTYRTAAKSAAGHP